MTPKSGDKYAEAFSPFREWEKEHDWRKEWSSSRRLTLLFTYQFSVMLGSGLSILPSLEILEKQLDQKFVPVIQDISEQLSEGKYLSTAVANFPQVFSPIYVAMIRVGESTGALAAVLRKLSDWLNAEDELIRKVKGAIFYPTAVMLCSLVMTLYLFLEVMPGFVSIFDELNADLPVLTEVLLLVTNLVSNPLAWTISGIGLWITIRLVRQYLRTEEGALSGFRLLVSTPHLGQVAHLVTLVRFCSALTALTSTGSNLPTSLRLSCLASGSPILRHESTTMVEAVAEGSTVADYLKSKPAIYPELMAQMMEAAEETGRVPQLMELAGRYFREEVDRRIEIMAALLEPLMLLIASLAVGLVLLGVFLPLYSFLGNLGN